MKIILNSARYMIAGITLLLCAPAIQAQTDTTIIIQENETGVVSFDGSIDFDNAGFTGDGFINTDNSAGMGITWEVCIPAGGTYTLQWRYAHGSTGDRTGKVMVDETEVIASVSFPTTGAWTTWDTTTAADLILESGPQQIRLEATNADGLANIDYISITGNSPEAGFCPVAVTGVSVSPSETTVGVKGLKQLTDSVLPANATNKTVNWESSDTTIATVSSSGLVSGVKEGSADIIVTTEDGFFTDTCEISVLTVPVYYLETSVSGEGSIDPASDSIAEGSEICISATPAPGWTFDGWSGDTSGTDNPVCITMDTNKTIVADFSQATYGDIQPDGYAGYLGTTGGGAASPIVVASASEFRSAVAGSNPAVILVSGNLNVGDVSIGSNKTIVGLDENAGLFGGTIEADGSNYIFKNLNFGPASGDVMEISGGTKVYITKCTFHDAGDEILSIVREADYVTVSWCKFYFDNTHNHAFGHLIGNSDDRTSDRGKLHVTMHHNWYAQGIRGRQPRVRYGHVHIYNNYYNSVGSGYCIGVGYECHIRVENTHFEGVGNPWADYGGVDNGVMGWSNLKFVSCSQPTFMPNTYPAFDLPYTYSMDSVEYVKTIVTSCAGNVFNINCSDTTKHTDFYNLTTSVNGQGSVSPGSAPFVVGTTITLSANPASGWKFDNWSGDYSGTDNPATIALDSNISVVANFSQLPIQVNTQSGSVCNFYPNPVNGELNIELNDEFSEGAIIELFDKTGRLILNKKVQGVNHVLDMENIPQGVYILKVTNNNTNLLIKRIVKQ